MNIDQIITVQKNNQTVTLIGVLQTKVKGKDTVKKVYPFFPQKDQNLDHYIKVLGLETVTDFTTSALRTKMQSAFLNEKGINEDLDKFTRFFESDSLSARQLTSTTCMARAMKAMKDGDVTGMTKWTTMAQELLKNEMLAKASATATEGESDESEE